MMLPPCAANQKPNKHLFCQWQVGGIFHNVSSDDVLSRFDSVAL